MTRLYKELENLFAWVEKQRSQLLELLGRDDLFGPNPLARKTIHENMSVDQHYHNYRMLRHIRESWDVVVRDHEDSWDSKPAVSQRCAVVGLAILTLNNALLSREALEAKLVSEQEAFIRESSAGVIELLHRLLEPQHEKEEDDDRPRFDASNN